MVWLARKVMTVSVRLSSAYRPRQRWPGRPSLLVLIRSTSVWCSNSVMFGVPRTASISVRCTAAPGASVTWAMRRGRWGGGGGVGGGGGPAGGGGVRLSAWGGKGPAQLAQPGNRRGRVLHHEA